MPLDLSRRDLLLAATGAATGAVLSPLPWKLVDDVAIWTQRPATPTPRPAGPVALRPTTCTLCPVACGLRVRCFGDVPVSVTGAPGHPASGGAICPLGLTAHHLSRHPLRARTATLRHARGEEPLSRDAAVAAVGAALARAAHAGRPGGLLVVDGRPGRPLSALYRAVAAAAGGRYATPPRVGPARTLAALSRRSPEPSLTLGVDLAAARRVVCFGAPLLEGWGTPGLLPRLRAGSRRRPHEERLEVVQVEAVRSRSAALADRWIAPVPGSEAALALGIARVLLDEGLLDCRLVESRTEGLEGFARAAAPFTPGTVSSLSGVPAATVVALARDLAAHRPAVVLGGGDPAGSPLPDETEAALAGLNLLLGSVGGDGSPIVARREGPAAPAGAPPVELADVPDGSVGVLVLDGHLSERAVPWSRLLPLLAPSATVVSLSPWRGGLADHADLHVPGLAPLEEAGDVPGSPDAAAATLSRAVALVASPEGAVDPAVFLKESAARASLVLPPLPPSAVEGVFASRRGRVVDGTTGEATPVGSLASPGALGELLEKGGCWVDDPAPLPRGRLSFLAPGETAESLSRAALAARPAPAAQRAAVAREAVAAAPPASLLTKLTRETALRTPPVAVAPWRA